MRKLFIVLVLTLNCVAHAKLACFDLFTEKVFDTKQPTPQNPSDSAKSWVTPARKVVSIPFKDLEHVRNELKIAAFHTNHIGENLLINKHLEQIFHTLNKTQYKSNVLDQRRLEILNRLLELMNTKMMNFENYIEITKDFLIFVGNLNFIDARKLNDAYSLTTVRNAINESGQLILALHINDGLFTTYEMNAFWAFGILPLGIPTKHYYVDLDLKSPLNFFMHDLAHALNRIEKLTHTQKNREKIDEKTAATLKHFAETLRIAATVPYLQKYIDDMMMFHLHESGSKELENHHDFLSFNFLPSYGEFEITPQFIDDLRAGKKYAQAKVRFAARKIIKELFRKYEFYKGYEIRKMKESELAEIIRLFLTHNPS